MEDGKKSGCGLLTAVFGSWRPRRSTSMRCLPTTSSDVNHLPRTPSTPIFKRRKSSDEAAFLGDSPERSHKQADRIINRPSPNHHPKATPPPAYGQHCRKTPDNNNNTGGRNTQQNCHIYGQNRKVPQGSMGISGELDTMINDHQRSKGSGNFIRASSGNMMMYGNLGNLRQQGKMEEDNSYKYAKKTSQEPKINSGNPSSLCRAISTRMDPEKLKMMGNEDYKNGRFAEALALYDAAISIDPKKASYRSNKSAALTALGRLLEAVFEGREAIRIEPFYQRAHNRLATLYLRLGEADKTMYHYKQAGSEADPDVITKAQNLQVHLNRCTEAKKQRDWNTLLKETSLAILAGADSALQIYTLKAEALLKMNRHQEADEVLSNGPRFEVEDCTKFFGPIGHASLLVIQAQVDLVAGRIDDAVEAAERAAKLDSNNKEAKMMVGRTMAVTEARSKGNELFKGGRYSEASIAYGEGLDHEPYNSVLLCNRAACRTKLGQFEKAIDDCTNALNIRPSYTKARLRRADCYAKLGKWQASIDDYEVLRRETPEDEEVIKALKEAKEQLNKQ